ncbi:MAG: 3-dehydroquinate dehydratase [Gemmatimonadota bacterium]|nr:MAG: 3-dehydroquinate dehydratase [Gemmatimonadota bacterium]
MSLRLLVIHGANLDLLGKREPHIYGTTTLDEIRQALEASAADRGHGVSWVVSNHEGDLVDALGQAMGKVDGILINPGAFTHTSVALRDALLAVSVPTVEVHLSNIHAREEFRRNSLIADVVTGQVSGFGVDGVYRGFEMLMDHLERSTAD